MAQSDQDIFVKAYMDALPDYFDKSTGKGELGKVTIPPSTVYLLSVAIYAGLQALDAKKNDELQRLREQVRDMNPLQD